MTLLATAPRPSTPEDAFAGDFDVHLTVDCADADGEVERLGRWAAAQGLKLTHIVLARGRMPSQPMLTLRGPGGLRGQQAAALLLADRLRAAGFEPVRVKIEAAPWNDGVPHTDAEARLLGPEYYFEHHLRLLPAADADLAGLAGLVAAHAAHLSWNARRTAADGRQQRFATQRCHGVGLHTAGERLERLVAAVARSGTEILEVEREFVVHDSNLAVDDGWIVAEDNR